MHEHADKEQKPGFFEKLKHNHYLMILICVIPIIILLGGSYLFGWKNNNLVGLALIIACLFSHLLMMPNHKNH